MACYRDSFTFFLWVKTGGRRWLLMIGFLRGLFFDPVNGSECFSETSGISGNTALQSRKLLFIVIALKT
jgi:hypothetical protein